MLRVRLNLDAERYEVLDGDSPLVLYSSPNEKDCNDFVRGEPEDSRDTIIRTLRAEVEHLASALEICGKNMGGAWTSGTRAQAAAARALLARLEAQP